MERVIKVVLSASVISLLIVNYLKPIAAYSQDLGRHLLTGQIILKTFSVPEQNIFSYTFPSFPFINHHFLSEVIFYGVYSLFGNNGLQILTLLLITAAFGMVFFYSARRYSYFLAAIISFLYLGILFERTDIRPELFSYLLLSIFVVILFRNREKFTKLIYLLPLLSLIWVNAHIYFFVGIVLVGLFVIDAFFQRKEVFKQLSIVLVLCCIAIVMNPNFIDGASYPLRVFGNYGYTIEENQTVFLLESLGFQKSSVGFLKIATFFLFLSLLLNFRKTRVIDWLLAITFTYAAFIAVRNLPLFVFVTFIPFAKNIHELSINTVKDISKNYPIIPHIIAICVVLLLSLQVVHTINNKEVGFGVAPGAERGVDFLTIQNIKGPIFNNFDVGSYLLYRLYPKEKVFIDGRPEAYPAEFITNTYIPMQESMELFKKIDAKYNFQTIFYSHTDMTPWGQKFLSEIVKNKEWKIIYLDDSSIILAKINGVNKNVVNKFGMELSDLKESSMTKSDMQSLLKMANFYQLTGVVDSQIVVYKKILTLEPSNCPALYNLAVILTQKNDSAAQFFAQRYSTSCQQSVLGQN